MYGATEAAARLTYLEPARLRDKLGSIGRAIPNVEIVGHKEDSRRRASEVRELVCRGSNVVCGYWNKRRRVVSALAPKCIAPAIWVTPMKTAFSFWLAASTT
jgi:acyl-CoA synthetase (AMP-forming)/AMP-acid ligase II